MDRDQRVKRGKDWLDSLGWTPFPFQLEAWEAYLKGQSGVVNAPTGSGKTYSLFVPALLEALEGPSHKKEKKGVKFLWITPLRALAKEIQYSGEKAAQGLGVDWRVAIRSGDTSSAERARQKKSPPECLVTTPESLHILLAQKGYPRFFGQLKGIVIDEWHDLLGSKRGVQIELALSRLKALLPDLKVWGISATIGNMEEAVDILLGPYTPEKDRKIIRSDVYKPLAIHSVFPDELDTLPWAGHLGISLLEKVVPIIYQSQSTLIFTNTRAQCEIWYQRLLQAAPELAGIIAMHHGSISRELRDWVEEALHEGKLKAVVCTSSLDLGVDFRPVETVVQVGSPKGVARFLQRAGRSGHQPGAESRIYFVPTHSLELVEGAALRTAVERGIIEQRVPFYRSFDVLLQYLMTLAVSEGFYPDALYQEITQTFSYDSLSPSEWDWILNFLVSGGEALYAYDEYKKVEVEEDGRYVVNSRKIAQRHRMSIGTIVGSNSMIIKFVKGGKIGTVEEWFISQLKPGDTFWFAGRSLELVRIREMTVQVRKSKAKKGKIPAWMGGRIPFSSMLSDLLRDKIDEASEGVYPSDELQFLQPLFNLQSQRSKIPATDEFLMEYFSTREGYHLVMYPFEGRFVHEGMGALIAYRLSLIQPQSFSIAMNDYGIELLSDSEIPFQVGLDSDMFSLEGLSEDIQASINSIEMAKRKFRDIANISGLVFKGYPGKQMKERHLQASSQLFFQVFSEHEPQNLLLRQAYDEVMNFQLEEARLRKALQRINSQKIIVTHPNKATPFAFPILVDRLRERLSSEKLEARIQKMKVQMG